MKKTTMYQIVCEHCGKTKETAHRKQRFCCHNCFRDSALPTSFNPRFFEQTDNPEVAYWVGFIAADGCVTPTSCGTPQISIALHPRDRDHLLLFRDYIGASHCRLYERTQNILLDMKIAHRDLRDGLAMWGLVRNKTYDFREAPELWSRPGIVPHLLRGLWDGDGCIWTQRKETGEIFNCGMSVTGNPWMMGWVREQLCRQGFHPTVQDQGHKILNDGTNYCTRTISLCKQSEVVKFIEWLHFTDPEVPGLARKRESARELSEWIQEARTHRPCLFCGTSFSPTRRPQVCCSPACSSARRSYKVRKQLSATPISHPE